MPNQNEEPKYKPFSKEEKEQIIARHKQLVDEFNEYLPFGQKLRYNESLEKELDKPETYALYRIGQEAHAKQEQQKRILTQMETKYGRRNESNSMSRSLAYAFDLSGTKEADKFNERLYRDYMQDPDKVMYQVNKKLLDFNPEETFRMRNDKVKLGEYYLRTYPLCEEAYVFHSTIENGNPTPAMKKAVTSMKKPLEVLAYTSNIVNTAHDLDSFAFPDMNRNQVEAMYNNPNFGPYLLEKPPIVGAKLNRVLEEAVMDKPWPYFGKFQTHNMPFEDGMLLKYKPVEKIEQNGQVKYEEVSYDKLFGPNQGQFSVQQRSEEEIFQIRCMNKSFVKQYTKWWGKEFQEIRGEEGPFDLARIEDRHKGGFFERYIWHSTSNEYKEMIQAMKDFHNPESKHFGDKVHLKGKANAYIDRKMLRQGYATIDQMKGTSKDRTQLALDIIEACDEDVDFEAIENDWYKENEVKEVEKEQALEAKDVEENPLVEDKQQVKEQVNEIKNEIKNEEEKEIVK